MSDNKAILLLLFCGMFKTIPAQNVGLGTTTPNASAILEIASSSKGLLIPRMTTVEITGIASPAKGLLVFNNSLNQLWINAGTPAPEMIHYLIPCYKPFIPFI